MTSRERPTYWVHVALIAVQLAFASGAVAGKMALNQEHVDPSALAFVRAAAGALCFHVARLVLSGRGATKAPRPTRRDHLSFALYAVLGVAVNQAFFLHGLKHASATSAALLAATIPVFTAGVAVLAGQEMLRGATLVGILVASAGVLSLTGVRNVEVGNLLITINSLAYAGYLVGVRRLLFKFGALTCIAWVFLYGALMLAPFGVLPLLRDAAHWSPRGLILVGWFIAVPTVFAYLTNALALGRARASIVAAYIYLQPLMVMLTAGKLLGELPTARVLLSGLGILAGVAVVAFGRAERKA